MKKNMTVDNTIVIHLKSDVSTGEVDFDMYSDVLGQEKVDAAYENGGVNTIDKGGYFEGYPLKIDVLKKIIADLEKQGCNYVSIDYNCDHPDYTFYGVDVHSTTQEEIDEVNKNKVERLAKTEKLRKDAEKLINEANNLEKYNV
jgi:hypothetical protein